MKVDDKVQAHANLHSTHDRAPRRIGLKSVDAVSGTDITRRCGPPLLGTIFNGPLL